MSRRTILATVVAAAILAAAGGYAAWWFSLADGIRDGVDRWAQARRADGWRVSHDGLSITGFPGPLRIHVAAPRLARPGAFDWQAPFLDAEVSPLAPERVRIDAAGSHSLALAADGRPLALEIDARHAIAELLLDRRGRLRDLDASLRDVATREVGGDSVTADLLRVGLSRPETAPADHRATSLAFDVAAEGVHLPRPAAPGFGQRIGLAAVRGRIQGPAESLAGWRDSGGTVEIERMAIEWQPLQLAAEGTLALDARMQPMLAMTASLRGFAETVDALAAAGVVRPKDAGPVKLVLGLMAKQPEGGGAPAIEVPVSIQEGRLYLGPAAIAEVPDVPWGERSR